jgi:hypothetical protein
MKTMRWWCAVLFTVLAGACGGDGSSGGATGNPIVGGMAGAIAMGPVPGAACSQGQSMPCMCTSGASGASECQLDNTFSVCKCDAPVAGAMAPVAGAGGAPPATPTPDAGQAMPEPTGAILVPPEDVAACSGAGTPPAAGEQVEVIQVRTDQVTWGSQTVPVVPGGFKTMAGTTYACFWADLDMPDKHHIIGWEGAIGGDRTVHHMQVSLSKRPAYLDAFGQGGLCGLPTVEYTWTGEKPVEWTPGLAGFPIGGPDQGGKARFVWQLHFEGATTFSGGFDAHVTTSLRKYDAGNFEQGDVQGILVPAGQASTHVATCTPEMTTEKLVHPIYVYTSMQHAHLIIKHIRGEHRRAGATINVFGDETALGFGFFDQQFKPHSPCIEVLPGDELVTTCDYQNTFPFDVTGGEATNQEMCTTFMQYFPRLPGTSNNFCGTIDATGLGP